MYRRRRNRRSGIGFGFDSFLDLIANVIGIIMRLILVAWVGARAYQATMQWNDEEPPPDANIVQVEKKSRPETKPDPLNTEIVQAQNDLDQARRQLLAYLDQLEKSRTRRASAQSRLEQLQKERFLLLALAQNEEDRLAAGKEKSALASLSLARVQDRSRQLLAQIHSLNKPAPRKVLHYRAPVSRVVDGEELMFECRAGKVSYIDLPAFLHEIKNAINDDKLRDIARDGSWNSTTSTVGAFRLRFSFQSAASLYSAPGSVRIQLAGWTVEPTTPFRGETQQQALTPGSDFRRLVDRLDPSHTTVTFWVYPDSFPLFRALRDHLHDQDIDVAGRPLPSEHPIGASIHGSRSRGQ